MSSFSLHVQKPCQEKWEEFNPTTAGGFCTGCQKEVIDFTTWSDDQIIAYFSKYKTPGCGRFKDTQLKSYKKDNVWQWRPIHWIHSIGITILLIFSQRVQAGTLKTTYRTECTEGAHFIQERTILQDSSITIRGIVKSFEDSTALANVKIVMRGGFIVGKTDSLGRFEFKLSSQRFIDTVEFSHPGFASVRLLCSTQEMNVIMHNTFDASFLTGTIGGFIVYRPWSPRSIWWKIKGVFRRNY